MPTPAMRPSSDTPRKAVGRKAKKPAISEIAASVSDQPTPAGRGSHRRGQVGLLEAVGPVADGELDAEIDAEADEQCREGHRDRVQLADHQQAEAPR